jgi:succinate-acetate transporter protein
MGSEFAAGVFGSRGGGWFVLVLVLILNSVSVSQITNNNDQ